MKRKGMLGKAMGGGLHRKWLDCCHCLINSEYVDERTIRVSCGSCVARGLM